MTISRMPMTIERDPKTHPEDWIWKEEREYRDRTSWQLTHKLTGKRSPWITYGDDWGYTVEEMGGMEAHEFAVWLARP